MLPCFELLPPASVVEVPFTALVLSSGKVSSMLANKEPKTVDKQANPLHATLPSTLLRQ
jgi:hypothetical protein